MFDTPSPWENGHATNMGSLKHKSLNHYTSISKSFINHYHPISQVINHYTPIKKKKKKTTIISVSWAIWPEIPAISTNKSL